MSNVAKPVSIEVLDHLVSYFPLWHVPDPFRVPLSEFSHTHFSSHNTIHFITKMPVQGRWRGSLITYFFATKGLADKGSCRPNTRHAGRLVVVVTYSNSNTRSFSLQHVSDKNTGVLSYTCRNRSRDSNITSIINTNVSQF